MIPFKNNFVRFLVLALCIIGSVPTPARATSTLTGTIRNAYGNPVATNCLIAPLGTPTVFSTSAITSTTTNFTTDTSGSFSVSVLPGNYKLTVGGQVRDSLLFQIALDGTSYRLENVITNAVTFTSLVSPVNELKVNKGQTNGYASLDGNGDVPLGQLPPSVLTNTESAVTLSGLLTIASNSPTSGILFPPHTHIYMGNSVGGNVMDIFLNPEHSVNQEVQFTSQGRIAILTGYDARHLSALQMSSGTFGGNQGDASPTYWNADYNPNSIADLNGLGYSHACFWEVGYYSNSLQNAAIGFRPKALDTNGTLDFIFFNRDNTTLNPVGSQQPGTVAGLEIFGNYNATGNGIAIHGRETRDVTSATISTANYGLDVDTATTVDLNLVSAVTFTNIPTLWNRTNQTDIKTIRLFGGFVTNNITLPSGWLYASNSAAPTGVGANTILQLKLERETTAAGTNYFVQDIRWFTYTPVLDTNAQQFITANGALSALQQGAINNFCLNAKLHGYWSNLVAIYPFVGGTAAADKWNLVNTNQYNITFSGSGNYTAGYKGDGTSAFGTTGITPSTALTNGSYQGYGIWINTTVPPKAGGYFYGTVGGGSYSAASLTGANTSWLDGGSGNTTAPNLSNTNYSGFMGANVYAGTCQHWINSVTSGGTGSVSALATGNLTWFNNSVESDANYTFAGVWQGMSNAQVALLIADISTFNATLGR